jgi:exodeoxyribonuclease VIII
MIGISEPEIGVWNCTDEEYYGDRFCLSHSQLEAFRESIPRYANRYIFKTDPDTETDALIFGKAFHMGLLEPEKFKNEVIAIPACDRRTKEGKLTYSLFLANSVGKLALSQDKIEMLGGMIHSCQQSSVTKAILASATRKEFALRWKKTVVLEDGETTEIWIRNKLDLEAVQRSGFTAIVDFKSVASGTLSNFWRFVNDYGLHRQAALYWEGYKASLGREPDEYLVAAIEKVPPYEVGVFRIPDAMRHYGAYQNNRDIAEYVKCLQTSTWASRFEGKVVDCNFPAYIYREGNLV